MLSAAGVGCGAMALSLRVLWRRMTQVEESERRCGCEGYDVVTREVHSSSLSAAESIDGREPEGVNVVR
jgi:hypothetical protein